MNVLSLFDGMSCGQIALNRIGITPKNYYASEIDVHAIKVAKANYPNIHHLGDVTKWYEWGVDWSTIDLVIAGSPCQGFSFAGKQLAFDDPRSKLFFKFVEILSLIRYMNPNVKFMLENVKMKKEYLNIITECLGVKPILINSSLVSAQNRQRYYWCNWHVEQPVDRGVYLSDILEFGIVDRDKSYCIDACYGKGGNVTQYIEKCRRQLVFIDQKPRGNNLGGLRALDGKTPCLSSNSWQHNNHLITAFTETRTNEAKRIRKEYKQLYGRDFSPRRAKELVPRTDRKMNCLTATYSLKEHSLIDEKLYYRKLTPIECERLQTVPDNYTSPVSNTQRYKMLGNGWTVDVVAHIFKAGLL